MPASKFQLLAELKRLNIILNYSCQSRAIHLFIKHSLSALYTEDNSRY